MIEGLEFLDSSPYEGELSSDDQAWLRRLQQAVDPEEFVIRTRQALEDRDEIVFTDGQGAWQAGRYVGTMFFEGRRLEIRPRLGAPTLAEWASRALNLVAIPRTALHQQSDSFIAWFLGLLWGRSFADAARHGLAGQKRTRLHEELVVRGRVDVRRTIAARRRNPLAVASRSIEKTLEHDASRTLVLAERTLTRWIGDQRWLPQRVDELMPRLRSAVGSRPALPSAVALRRIRYTPITLPFKPLVEMSYRLARRQGFAASNQEGRAEGLLLDVAELWELFLLAIVRRVLATSRVTHGTRADEEKLYLLRAAGSTAGLARIKPDIMVWDGTRPVAVIDAKYKRLAPSRERPEGYATDDLYQLNAYVSRLSSDDFITGVLAYPRDPDQSSVARAESAGPWLTTRGDRISFTRLPIDGKNCEDAVRSLLGRAR